MTAAEALPAVIGNPLIPPSRTLLGVGQVVV